MGTSAPILTPVDHNAIFKTKKVNKSEDAIIFPLPTGIYLIGYSSTFLKLKKDGANQNHGFIKMHYSSDFKHFFREVLHFGYIQHWTGCLKFTLLVPGQ